MSLFTHVGYTYGIMRGDPFDCSTKDKSVGKLSKMHCYAFLRLSKDNFIF